MNFRGDVLRQLGDERRFYERLAYTSDKSELEKPAARLTYSRSSFFTLLVAELLVQTLSLINNPQMRGRRGEKDTPRRLRRMIFTLPTAMPVREQRLLRSRALAAVKLVWDLMGWTEAPPPNLLARTILLAAERPREALGILAVASLAAAALIIARRPRPRAYL